MRKAVLFNSIVRFLEEGEDVIAAAYIWKRHRLFVPFAAVSMAGVMWVAAWAGWEDWPTRFAFGAAGAAIAVMATTEYRVLARTSRGIVLLRASRIRQFAKEMMKRLDHRITLEPVGGTLLATDWQVDDLVYTVPKSSERAMQEIVGAGSI